MPGRAAAATGPVQVAFIDPLDRLADLSRLMVAQWPAPSLHYSEAYLRWQFQFPGPVPCLAVAAFAEERIVAFVAAIPRCLRLEDRVSDVYLVSFLIADQEWRGSSISGVVYLQLVDALRDAGLPIIGFALPGSAGERAGQRVYPARRFQFRTLGPFPGYGYLPRKPEKEHGLCVRPVSDDSELLSVMERCGDPHTLCSAPRPDQLKHYGQDPQPRAKLIALSPEGEAVGAAMVVRYQFATARGVTAGVMIDSLFLPEPRSDALAALAAFSSELWATEGHPAPVTVPNLWGVDPDLARSAGLRQLPSQFSGYLCTMAPDHPFLRASGTNLEVV